MDENYIVRAPMYAGYVQDMVIDAAAAGSGMPVSSAIERGYIAPTDLPLGKFQSKVPTNSDLIDAYTSLREDYQDLLGKFTVQKDRLAGAQTTIYDLESKVADFAHRVSAHETEKALLQGKIDAMQIDLKMALDMMEGSK